MFPALPVRADLAAALLTIVAAALPASAETFVFDTEPFAGTTVLDEAGRQFVGNELFIPGFDFATDVFAFDAAAYGVDSLSFQNSLAADLPSSGVNVVVVRDTDTDNNPETPFLAGTAAGLIAAQVDDPAPGFFVYHNSNLEMSRLVFSTDLSTTEADLKIVARLTNPTGDDAIALMPSISAANFQLVPEPTGALLAVMGGLALLNRRRSAV